MMGAWGEAARDLIHQIGSCVHNTTGDLSATAYSSETCSGRTARECGLHYGVQLGGLLVLEWALLGEQEARCLSDRIPKCFYVNVFSED